MIANSNINNMANFRGTGVALVTPFKNDFSIDFKALERIVNHIIDGGIEYLVLLGTTSEAVTLSNDEKEAVVSYVKEINNGRVGLVVGIGGNNTRQIENTIYQTDFSGIDGILSVAPYYNKPGQKGLYQHFKAIANASPVPVILYNVPGRTSSNIEAGTCIKLANDFSNIVAVKEASGNFHQVMKIIDNTSRDFLVISGDDLLTLPIISVGGAGVISVLGNAFPEDWSDMVRKAIKSNITRASTLHYKYMEMIGLIFEEGNPAGIKAALSSMGLCSNMVRLPLTTVSRTTLTKINNLLADLSS